MLYDVACFYVCILNVIPLIRIYDGNKKILFQQLSQLLKAKNSGEMNRRKRPLLEKGEVT